MKSCVIFGDLSSDETDDNYPTVAVCDECVAKHEAAQEDSKVVSVSSHDPVHGDECDFCGKTLEQEAEEL